MAIHATNGIKIFYSYAQEDEELLIELDKYLIPLQREGLACWDKRKLLPGVERTSALLSQMEAAHIILLLISPNYTASDECYIVEMPCALQMRSTGKAYVIPIVLSPVDLQGTPFERLEVLPRDKKPVTSWDNQNDAFVAIVAGIKLVIDDMIKQPPLNGDHHTKKTIGAAFATHAQRLESFSLPTTPPTPTLKLDFRRKLVTEYDLDAVMQAFKEPLDYGKAFPFVVAGDAYVLREYIIERMVQKFKEEIQGECFTTSIDLNQQDLSSYPLQSLLEEKIKRRFNYTHARELVMKRWQEHVILTVWNYDLPILTVQDAITAFWRSFVPPISRYLCRKKLCFVLILAHLPPENQPWSMQDVTPLPLPDFDVQRGIRPWLSRNLHSLNVPAQARNYCLNQLEDLYPNPVQILRRMEDIAEYLQGKYDRGRFCEEKVPARRRSVQK